MIGSRQNRVKELPRARESVLVEVTDRAVEVIGNKTAAMRWMGTPVRALNYATPVSMLHTKKGREAVLAVSGKLEYGVL
jgi:putative toxin-antitoxin system antitoxin component (TIGR02293 family)